MVLAFTGLRWEEAVAVPIGNVSLDGQCMTIDRTASESGGRRDVREDLKTRAAERIVMIPDIAMLAVRRLAVHGAPGRERSDGTPTTRLPDRARTRAFGPTDRRAAGLVFLGANRSDLVGRTGFEPVTSSVSGNSKVSVTVGPSRAGSPSPARTI